MKEQALKGRVWLVWLGLNNFGCWLFLSSWAIHLTSPFSTSWPHHFYQRKTFLLKFIVSFSQWRKAARRGERSFSKLQISGQSCSGRSSDSGDDVDPPRSLVDRPTRSGRTDLHRTKQLGPIVRTNAPMVQWSTSALVTFYSFVGEQTHLNEENKQSRNVK